MVMSCGGLKPAASTEGAWLQMILTLSMVTCRHRGCSRMCKYQAGHTPPQACKLVHKLCLEILTLAMLSLLPDTFPDVQLQLYTTLLLCRCKDEPLFLLCSGACACLPCLHQSSPSCPHQIASAQAAITVYVTPCCWLVKMQPVLLSQVSCWMMPNVVRVACTDTLPLGI